MKKFSWILALFAALTLLFIGCPTGGDDDGDGGERPKGNPIVEDGKFLIISDRANSWDGIDVRNANPAWGNNASGWTADKEHTMTIQGWAGVGGSVILAEGEKGTVLKQEYAGNDGMYKIVQKLSWDLINSDANNFRIQGPTTTKEFTIYELTINDGTSDVYKLSTDAEIKAIAHGTTMTEWSNKIGTKWFLKSGGPTIIVMDPALEGTFVAVEGIAGVPTNAKVGDVIDLPTTATPSIATNTAVTWAIKSAGTTGATLAGNKLTVAAEGDVIVTGTVVKGKSETEDFTKDFEINVTEAAALGGTKLLIASPALETTVKAVGTGAKIDYFADNTGYQLTYGTEAGSDNWQRVRSEFKITLPKALKNYTTVTADIEGVSGDVSFKDFMLLAATDLGEKFDNGSTPSVHPMENFIISSTKNEDKEGGFMYGGPTGKETITLKMDGTKAGYAAVMNETTIAFSIFVNTRNEQPAGTPSAFNISNIKFNEGVMESCPVCGQLPCACLDCGCGCAACITAGNCGDGATCAAGCKCSHHLVAEAFDVTLDLEAFNTNALQFNSDVPEDAPTTNFADGALTIGVSKYRQAIRFELDAAVAQKIFVAFKLGKAVKYEVVASAGEDSIGARIAFCHISSGAGWNGSGVSNLALNQAEATLSGELTANGDNFTNKDTDAERLANVSALAFQATDNPAKVTDIVVKSIRIFYEEE